MTRAVIVVLFTLSLLLPFTGGSQAFSGDSSQSVGAAAVQLARAGEEGSSADQDSKVLTDEGFFHGRARIRQKIVKELGLSDEQRRLMRELTQASWEKTRDARDAIKKIRDEKLNMLRTGKVDKAKLAALDQELVKHHTELDVERLRVRRERAALLTPDQAKRLGEMLAKWRDKQKERRSKHDAGPGRPTGK